MERLASVNGPGHPVGARIPASWRFDFALPLTFMGLVILRCAIGRTWPRRSGGLVAVAAAAWPHKLGLMAAAITGISSGDAGSKGPTCCFAPPRGRGGRSDRLAGGSGDPGDGCDHPCDSSRPCFSCRRGSCCRRGCCGHCAMCRRAVLSAIILPELLLPRGHRISLNERLLAGSGGRGRLAHAQMFVIVVAGMIAVGCCRALAFVDGDIAPDAMRRRR